MGIPLSLLKEILTFAVRIGSKYSHSIDCSDTVWPFMVRSCTELLKSTSPSLQNITVDSAAIFSQNFSTMDEEIWLKSFNLKSF